MRFKEDVRYVRSRDGRAMEVVSRAVSKRYFADSDRAYGGCGPIDDTIEETHLISGIMCSAADVAALARRTAKRRTP